MRAQRIILILATATLTWGCEKEGPESLQAVNSVLGDVSFIEKFGRRPDATADENLRIMTHLEYVEKQLRHKDCGDLTEQLQQRRSQLLDFLHDYWTSNTFPRNYDYKDKRIPCFIDKDGRICAVGYLIERSVGRKVAEEINRKHKYERIITMNDAAVDEWISGSGLSREECAWIQPEYGFQDANGYNHIDPGYGISSSILGAANLSLGTINAIQIDREQRKKAIPIIGLLTGAGQVILGAVMMPEETQSFYGHTTNESEKILSLINIGLGATTMILSTWNLVTTPEPNQNDIGWNIYCIPTPSGDIGLGLSLTRRF